MRRDVSMSEISDGKLYGLNDMVKADCQDCIGCSACCHNMGQSIVLDPLDIMRLKSCLNLSFEGLMKEYIELGVIDGVILPNLKMNEQLNKCSFLDDNERCSIHSSRPGICRIFPLGRVYENGDFRYFLQVNECEKTNRSKVKVSKWIATSRLKANQKFISNWHYFLKDVEEAILASDEENAMKQMSMYLLQQFYVTNYKSEECFYEEVLERMMQARENLGL